MILFFSFVFLILLLPGLTWKVSFSPDGKDPAEYLADAIGLSLAISALVGLGMFLLKMRVSAALMISVYAAMSGLVLVLIVRRLYKWRLSNTSQPITNHRSLIPYLLPLLLFALILAWRFYQAHDLALPAWVDSIHHTLIVQLMLETGRVPASFEPYMPVPFYYHFGFHIFTSLFAFFSRLPSEQAVLVVGQVFNAVVALSIYRLGMALWRDWRRASVAMLLIGFVFQMPAYYVAWGRYTLLGGVILLALGMGAALEVVYQGASPERVARLVLLTGGVFLTHYFAAGLLTLFFILLIVERTVFGPTPVKRLWESRNVTALVAGVLAGILLAAPWLWHVWQHSSAYVGVRAVLPGQILDQIYFPNYLSYLWYLLGPRRSHVLLIVAILSLGLIGWREKTRPLAIWGAALGALSLPWGVNFSPFRPDHGVIVAFLPATLLVADAFLSPLENFSRPWFGTLTKGTLAAALMGLVVWGVRETGAIVNPTTIFATEADLVAMEWIRENTPEDANFLVNVVHWQRGAYRGVDGGWWITPLTGRKTLLPPALYLQGSVDYATGINDLAAQASQFEACTPGFWALMQAAEITHIYLSPGEEGLRPEGLVDCPGLTLRYVQEGVNIYQVELKGES